MKNLQTPFGEIVVLADGQPLVYTAISKQDERVSACYRVRIPTENHAEIACVLLPDDKSVLGDASFGEGYLCMEFIRHSTELTIGMAVDESSAPSFSSETIENGLVYRHVTNVESLVFGIAWLHDHSEHDVRTWYAADPTLD